MLLSLKTYLEGKNQNDEKNFKFYRRTFSNRWINPIFVNFMRFVVFMTAPPPFQTTNFQFFFDFPKFQPIYFLCKIFLTQNIYLFYMEKMTYLCEIYNGNRA